MLTLSVLTRFDSIYDGITQVFSDFFDMIDSAVSATLYFAQSLDEIDASVVSMYDSGNFSVVSDAPVLQAVATIKYLLPADIFYLFYTILIVMCLYTTFIIVRAIVNALKSTFSSLMYNSTSGLSTTGGLQSFTSFFRG